GGTLTVALLSAGAVAASLVFYLNRNREAQRPILAVSPRFGDAAKNQAPPPPKQEKAPPAPQPQAPLPVGKNPENVVFLAAAPAPAALNFKHSYGLLRREILRQAFLLAARDEFGLSTHDAGLREPNPKQLPAANQFRVDSEIQTGGPAQVLVEQGEAATRQQI